MYDDPLLKRILHYAIDTGNTSFPLTITNPHDSFDLFVKEINDIIVLLECHLLIVDQEYLDEKSCRMIISWM